MAVGRQIPLAQRLFLAVHRSPINAYPNYTVSISDPEISDSPFQLHFIALFSQSPTAAPLVLLQGWPGSFLEFLPVLDILRTKYTPQPLPFHVIVPSLPGYAYSSLPPSTNFTIEAIARVIDTLMTGLGFNSYIAQGGDIGSFVARILGATSPHCVAVHLNMAIGISPPSDPSAISSLSPQENLGLQRAQAFNSMGSAYARLQGTRPSTLGLTLSSSPLALLAYIAEKFLQWSDTSPSLDSILDSVTLYWFTSTLPRCIYPYRQFLGENPIMYHGDTEKYFVDKPLGYSWHPKELAPVPKNWVETTGRLVWYRGHKEGGHFSALEVPGLFVEDLEGFVWEVWKGDGV